MHEVNARAALVPAPNVGDGLSTTVAREEVADALSADGPVELILDVTSYSKDGQPTETRNIAVSWERPDLERLLREGSGDRIQLTFDRAAIEEAMSDVEAHGLREKALVFAVAVTTAAGGAAVANAAPTAAESGGTGGGTSSYMTGGAQDQAVTPGVPASLTASGVDDTAGTPVPPALTSSGIDDQRAPSSPASSSYVPGVSDFPAVPTPAPDTSYIPGVSDFPAVPATPAPDTSYVPGVSDFPAVPATPVVEQPTLSPDDRAVDFSTPSPTPSLSPDDRAVDFSTPSPTPSLSPDDRPVSFASPDTAFPAVGPDDRAFDRSSPQPATPIVATGDDGGISVSAPSPEAVALGGAILIAITAAGFAVAGRRRITPAH